MGNPGYHRSDRPTVARDRQRTHSLRNAVQQSDTASNNMRISGGHGAERPKVEALFCRSPKRARRPRNVGGRFWDSALLEGVGEQEQASPQYRRNDGQHHHCDNGFSQHNATSQKQTRSTPSQLPSRAWLTRSLNVKKTKRRRPARVDSFALWQENNALVVERQSPI